MNIVGMNTKLLMSISVLGTLLAGNVSQSANITADDRRLAERDQAAIQEAIMNPTPENAQKAQKAQNDIFDRAERFAKEMVKQNQRQQRTR